MSIKYIVLVAVAFVAACASPSEHVITGKTRPAIAPEQVVIYDRPPPAFEEVALLDASSHSAFGPGGQKSMDKVIERLKVEAAKLGANGVLLEGFADAETGSLGTGLGGGSLSRGGGVGVGVGGSLGMYKKTGRGRAIYVPSG